MQFPILKVEICLKKTHMHTVINEENKIKTNKIEILIFT